MIEILFYIIVSVIVTILVFLLMGIMAELYHILKAIHGILDFITIDEIFIVEGEDDGEDQ